ncbi:hypothetical protein MB901379_00328 [Mycobacterium basiliense]|uniref:Mce associated membrane protein n=1 Tax=Mycobacterium basiliense TaxID=2094119 RepID=A0A447G8Z5_9MYCO|nr:Mce protein [Mycobacterium basiliense]VDM86802.1 hypothetical protein MB901379_00328 [Mycobacterium basiliense]
MEGDAGASRLNPTDADDSFRPEVTPEDSVESDGEAGQTGPEVTAEDSVESEGEAGQTGPEVADQASVAEPAIDRRPSRFRRGWVVGVSAAMLLAAGAVGAGGYFALRSHQESQAIARQDAEALQAAKDCVAITQAPDTSAMAASEQKIIDCGTDQYRSQAVLYSSMLVQAYQAANVHVQLTDMRAAVERNNDDGSVDVLVALRVRMSNDQDQNQETGYRLRVRMTPTDGQFKISRLDQVAK